MKKEEQQLPPDRENQPPTEIKTVQGISGTIYERTHRVMGDEVVGHVGKPIRINPDLYKIHYEEA